MIKLVLNIYMMILTGKLEYYERAASLCGNNNNNNSNKQLVLQLFDQGKCKYKKK